MTCFGQLFHESVRNELLVAGIHTHSVCFVQVVGGVGKGGQHGCNDY